ncbi:SigE family RNA polymerase sigma factor [uncultured Serinicoccus sp.]|uniref:SigE family RNA polymerase sigma factor n=1 Tax=uncultured Serinicoccus sp. TaxID=735514 RepID=UPI002619F34C|nr:SigE family RNA polymerase sigma factor [uncultured Serinicoccus sp.]
MGRRIGEEDDFAVFVGAHQLTLQRAAFLLCGDREVARDLVQEALTRTAARWPKVREGMPLAYTRRVLYTVHVDRWRRHGAELATQDPPEQVDVDGRSWADSLAVRQVLQQLPPRARAVVVLRYFEDLDVATTAQTLGISQGTVKSQTSLGLARMRELLSEVSTDV